MSKIHFPKCSTEPGEITHVGVGDSITELDIPVRVVAGGKQPVGTIEVDYSEVITAKDFTPSQKRISRLVRK